MGHRYTTAPQVTKNGAIRFARLTPRDIDGIFLPLVRHRYLRKGWLQLFSGMSDEMVKRRLREFKRDPRHILELPEGQLLHFNARYRELVYEIGDGGIAALRNLGIPAERPKATSQFVHELLSCEAMVSFEWGAKQAGVRFISWNEIQQAEAYLRAGAAESNWPRYMTAAIRMGKKREQFETKLAADGTPFGIESGGRFYFTPGIEADTGSERIRTNNPQVASIEKKLRAYLDIIDRKLYRSHFGFPAESFYIPFVISCLDPQQRINHILEALMDITNGKGSKHILLSTYPPFLAFEKPPAPSGDMLTREWQRAGFPPLKFPVA